MTPLLATGTPKTAAVLAASEASGFSAITPVAGSHSRAALLVARRAGVDEVRPDELLLRAQHTAVADVVGRVVEVAEGTEADLFGVLLQQAFGLVGRSVGLAVGFAAEAGTRFTDLHPGVEGVDRAGGRCDGLAVVGGRARGGGRQRRRTGKPHTVATRTHADLERRVGQGCVVGNVGAGRRRPFLERVGIRGWNQGKVGVAAVERIVGGPGALEDGGGAGVHDPVATGQRPTERVDGLHRHPVEEVAAPGVGEARCSALAADRRAHRVEVAEVGAGSRCRRSSGSTSRCRSSPGTNCRPRIVPWCATLTAVGNSTLSASARLPGTAMLVNSGWSASGVAWLLAMARKQPATISPTRPRRTRRPSGDMKLRMGFIRASQGKSGLEERLRVARAVHTHAQAIQHLRR